MTQHILSWRIGEKLPLATLDRRLGEAALLMGVQLFEKGG